MAHRPASPAIVLAIALVASPARADDAAAAEALFAEAKALIDAGKVAEACPKLEASLELDRRLGTLVNLARCHEEAGSPGRAHVRWAEASRWPDPGDERVAIARERLAVLESAIARLTVDVRPGPDDLEVELDGQPLRVGAAERVVDPGRHVVTVLREGAVLTRREIDLVAGARETTVVDLVAIAGAHPAPRAVPPPAPPPVSSTQKTAGFVVGAVGLAGITTFGALEIAALAVRGSAFGPGGCSDGNVCTPRGYDRLSTAGDLAEAGQWVGIAGAAVLAVGITLVLTAPSDPGPAPARPGAAPALRLRGAVGGVALELGGAF